MTQSIVAVGLVVLPALSLANSRVDTPMKPVEVLQDPVAVANHFRAMGYGTLGSVAREVAAGVQLAGQGFPTFSSSFSVGGVTYPFTMIGEVPASGRSTFVKSVIIPLRMNFVNFGPTRDVSHSFDPAQAVTNIVHSPLYVPANYPQAPGFDGQFVDQMQRAAFWNQMDANHGWHVLMDKPEVIQAIDIEVTPESGSLQADANGNPIFGNVLLGFMDSQARTILEFLGLGADRLPIFVTDNVTAEALGYHTAYVVTAKDKSATQLQTFIYTSWLDPALVPPHFADVSTFDHELAEWTNDPFINNVVPEWVYPPPSDPAATCSFNPLLEVGDPQGNGPTYADFAAIGIPIDGVTYHLPQLVLWQWFTDQVPSTAFGGWFTFPDPSSLRVPAVYCP